MKFTVHQLGQLAGVSVRTLHYYDEIGLLEPSSIEENGYRQYDQDQIIKLQQILFFKELEFSLEQIKQMINAVGFNREQALKDQRRFLELKQKKIVGLIKTLDHTLNHLKGGGSLKTDDLYQGLRDPEMDQYQDEVKARWGNTEAYRQSQERTKNWTKADYDRIKKAGEEWTQKLADLKNQGHAVHSPAVQEMIGIHYEGLRVFYEPNYEMYQGLGQMYVDDVRFEEFYNKFAPDLAVFMRDAMHYFAKQKTQK